MTSPINDHVGVWSMHDQIVHLHVHTCTYRWMHAKVWTCYVDLFVLGNMNAAPAETRYLKMSFSSNDPPLLLSHLTSSSKGHFQATVACAQIWSHAVQFFSAEATACRPFKTDFWLVGCSASTWHMASPSWMNYFCTVPRLEHHWESSGTEQCHSTIRLRCCACHPERWGDRLRYLSTSGVYKEFFFFNEDVVRFGLSMIFTDFYTIDIIN